MLFLFYFTTVTSSVGLSRSCLRHKNFKVARIP